MANSKQKPAPEGPQRRPGKTKFAIPRREAPPIDGSYLDRLFADYDRQTKELKGQAGESQSEVEVPEKEQVNVSQSPVYSTPQFADTASAEVDSLRPPDVTVPFRPQEVVSAETERPAARSAAETPTVEVPDVMPAAAAGQEPPLVEGPVKAVDDEALLDQWKKRHRLGKGEVKVLRVMVRMCREAGGDHCYVKIAQLMKDAELKERQTQFVVRSLTELRLIEKLAEYSNADRIGTKYRVLFQAG